MTKTGTLLLNLSPDPVSVGHLAFKLYGDVGEHSQGKIKEAILDAKFLLGWEIRRSGDTYLLSQKHFDLIQANAASVRHWNDRIRFTPSNLEAAGGLFKKKGQPS